MKLILALFMATPLFAANSLYIAQASAGANDGSSCANAKAASYFNAAANWSATPTGIQIGPDTTVHVCGTWTGGASTNFLTFQGSGSSGHPIILLFESGAIMQPSYCDTNNGCIHGSGTSFITIDGGGNAPDIQNLLDGTAGQTCPGGACQFQAVSRGINFSNSSNNITIQNFTVSNFYIRQEDSTDGVDVICYQVDDGSNFLIKNSALDHCRVGISWDTSSGTTQSGFTVQNNTMTFWEHGIYVADPFTGSHLSGISIHDNDFGGGAYLWDACAPAASGCGPISSGTNMWHHDAIHMFSQVTGADINTISIYNNYYHGIWSRDSNYGASHITAPIFLECLSNASNVYIYNNVFDFSQGGALNQPTNGDIKMKSAGGFNSINAQVFNNTAVHVSDFSSLINLDTSSTGTVARNNISQATDGLVCNGTCPSFTSTNNLCYQSTTSTCGTSPITTNPQLTNYVPALASPATGAALNLTNLGISTLDSDKGGVARPGSGGWDIGAYQASGLSISPASLTFSSQAVGTTSAQQTFTITNNTAGTVTISGVSMIGANLGDFAQSNNCTSLAVSATCTVNVTFTPTATGSRLANVQISTSVGVFTPSVSGTGTTAGPVLSCTPASLSFGSQNINTTSGAQSITCTNTGNASLSVTSVTLTTGTNFARSTTPSACATGCTVATNGTFTISATFTPLSAASLTDTLNVTSNAPSSVDHFSLSGTGVNPSNINLIQTAPCGGQSFPNPGGAACTITATSAGSLLIAKGCSAFNTGTSNTISSITDNKSDTWAEAGAAKSIDTNSNSFCDIWYAANVPTGVTTVTITPSTTLTMGWVIQEVSNVNTLDQTAVLNSQPSAASPTGAAVTITTANEFVTSLLNPFTSVSGIHAGSACTNDSLLFSDGWAHQITSSTGAYSCQWDLSSAGTWNSSTASFKQVTGGAPIVGLSVSSLSFSGLQTIQTNSPTLTVTLSNNGTGSLTITSIAPAGGNAADFTITSNTCGATLAINASCNVVAQFKPGAAGARSSTLVFTTNAATSPDNVSLSGTAILQPTSFGGVSIRGMR